MSHTWMTDSILSRQHIIHHDWNDLLSRQDTVMDTWCSWQTTHHECNDVSKQHSLWMKWWREWRWHAGHAVTRLYCSSCLAKPTRSHWPGGAGVGVVLGRKLLRDGLRCGKKEHIQTLLYSVLLNVCVNGNMCVTLRVMFVWASKVRDRSLEKFIAVHMLSNFTQHWKFLTQHMTLL